MLVSYLFSGDSISEISAQPHRRRLLTMILAFADEDDQLALAEGDLLIEKFCEASVDYSTLLDRLAKDQTDDALSLSADTLNLAIGAGPIHLQVIQGLSKAFALFLHYRLLRMRDDHYIGCVAVDPDDPIHDQFFLEYTGLYAIYTGKGLKLYHSEDEVQRLVRKDLRDDSISEVDWDFFRLGINGRTDSNK